MVTKEVIGNELYVYIFSGGKKELLYKRWLALDYGMIFCKLGNFISKHR